MILSMSPDIAWADEEIAERSAMEKVSDFDWEMDVPISSGFKLIDDGSKKAPERGPAPERSPVRVRLQSEDAAVSRVNFQYTE